METSKESTTPLGNGDEESTTVILQLQLQDLEDLRTNSKWNTRAKSTDDADLAFDMYEEELERYLNRISDRRLARTLAQTEDSEGEMLATECSVGDTAANDDEIQAPPAKRARIDGENESTLIVDATSSERDEALVHKSDKIETDAAESHVITGHTEPDDNKAGPSKSAQSLPNMKLCRKCTSCALELDITELKRLTCEHEYCLECLIELFDLCLKDETLFPPRCCYHNIPLDVAGDSLDADYSQLFQDRKEELETPDKTYCCNLTCSKFIPTGLIRDGVAICPACSELTCSICKAAAHPGGPCPVDPTLEQVLQVADDNGWRRCYSCRSIVELNFGCNHMT